MHSFSIFNKVQIKTTLPVHNKEKWYVMQIAASVPTNDHAKSRFCICTVNTESANGRILLFTTIDKRFHLL